MSIGQQFAHVSITPDMRIHVEGYGDMTEDVAKELALIRHEEEQELATGAALLRQAHIAKESGTEQHGSGRAGLRFRAQIDAPIVAYWERRYGRGFFTDKSNLEWFLKKHPSCAIKYVSQLFGYSGPLLHGKALSGADRMTLPKSAVSPKKK